MMFVILLSAALQAPPAEKAKEANKPAAKTSKPEGKSFTFGPVGNGEGFMFGPAPEKGTLDQQIQQAMANHPDLRIAQLQVELAQAKLEQERQRVTQRISAARAAIKVQKAAVAAAEAAKQNTVRLIALSAMSKDELPAFDAKLASAQGELAAAEAELNAAVGPVATSGRFTFRVYDGADPPQLMEFRDSGVGPGIRSLIPESFRIEPLQPVPLVNPAPTPPATSRSYLSDFPAMLDARVTPGKKTGTPLEVLTELLTKAAGDKPVPLVRATDRFDTKLWKNIPTITLVGETDELGSWLQQYIDALNTANFQLVENDKIRPKFNIYVRNYGLLVALESEAPADATTVLNYWRKQHAERRAAMQDKRAESNAWQVRGEVRPADKVVETPAQGAAPKAAERAPPPKAKD